MIRDPLLSQCHCAISAKGSTLHLGGTGRKKDVRGPPPLHPLTWCHGLGRFRNRLFLYRRNHRCHDRRAKGHLGKLFFGIGCADCLADDQAVFVYLELPCVVSSGARRHVARRANALGLAASDALGIGPFWCCGRCHSSASTKPSSRRLSTRSAAQERSTMIEPPIICQSS